MTHPKLGFWNQSRETCWTLIQSGIALGKRQREGVGTLVSPGFVVNKRVAFLHHQVGEQVLTVCTYAPNDSSEYRVLFGSVSGVLDGAPSGDSLVLL